MKNFLNITKLAFIVLTVIAFVSCSDDDDSGNIIDPAESNTIVDFVVGNENYTSLLAAVQRADLATTLAGDGPFTVFAPDNDAFDAFLNGASLEDVPVETLRNILLNHVVAGSVLSTDLTTGYINTQATAGSRNVSAYVNTASGVQINGVSTVVGADNQVDNGVIHAVDAVIGIPTMLTFVAADSELSTLATVATTTSGFETDFGAVLSSEDSDLTLLAPSNQAFVDLGDISGLSAAAVEQVLLNHVIGAQAFSTDLANSYTNTLATFGDTDNNLSLYINTDDGVTFNGISDVSTADITASNGVIHKVDAVITLPDVTTFATADPTFSTLVAALTADASFGYVAALQTPNGTAPAPFTVFAPTNDAFGQLLDDLGVSGLGDIDTATLAATLELHVVAGANVVAVDLPGLDGAMVETLGGGMITIDANAPAIIDPDGDPNPIVVTDVQAANGVIHAISRVIRDL